MLPTLLPAAAGVTSSRLSQKTEDGAAAHHLSVIPDQRIYKQKQRTSLSRENTILGERGKERSNKQADLFGVFVFVFHRFTTVRVADVLFSQSELLLLELLLELWKR